MEERQGSKRKHTNGQTQALLQYEDFQYEIDDYVLSMTTQDSKKKH